MRYNLSRKIVAGLLMVCTGFIACHGDSETLKPAERAAVQDSVQTLARAIAKDVTLDGPVAWLRYFDASPDFFMASGGELQFGNYDTAKSFINNMLVKNIRAIELHWGDVRVEPLTLQLATMGATFRETITDASGNKTSFSGYCTALAKQLPQGWKLHQLHWSMLP